jgi:hypothetical protein
MVNSEVVISGGYLLIGIVIRGICEVIAIKAGKSISQLEEL